MLQESTATIAEKRNSQVLSSESHATVFISHGHTYVANKHLDIVKPSLGLMDNSVMLIQLPGELGEVALLIRRPNETFMPGVLSHHYQLVDVPSDSGTFSFSTSTPSEPELFSALLLESDLSDALRELYAVQKVAEEDEDVVPTDDAVRRAERMLRAMYRISPRYYSVYPAPDGEIVIDPLTKQGTSLVVLCNPDGSAECLTYVEEEYRKKNYSPDEMLPDDFVLKALQDTTPATDS